MEGRARVGLSDFEGAGAPTTAWEGQIEAFFGQFDPLLDDVDSFLFHAAGKVEGLRLHEGRVHEESLVRECHLGGKLHFT